VRRRIVLAVYLGGFIQGVALILFPAAGPLLTDPDGFGLSSGQYGLLFTPHILAGILASTFASRYADRIGVKRVLTAGLALDVVAMGLLALSHTWAPGRLAYLTVMVAITAVGAGFGLCISALNAFAFDLFTRRADSAVTALHLMVGLGQVGAALILSLFVMLGFWWGAPILVGLLGLSLLVFQSSLRMTLSPEHRLDPRMASTSVPARVWFFALVVFLYGICEGALGNWSPIFLEQDVGLSKAQAGLGLSIFWGSVTGGRLLFTLVGRWITGRHLYIVAPLVTCVGLTFFPAIRSPMDGFVLLGVLGLSMSTFFPLSISRSSAERPQHVSTISGLLVASLAIGIGLSSTVLGFFRFSVGLAPMFYVIAATSAVVWLLAAGLSVSRPRF
jgi:MFS family permease